LLRGFQNIFFDEFLMGARPGCSLAWWSCEWWLGSGCLLELKYLGVGP
jgi:hypothetical protein